MRAAASVLWTALLLGCLGPRSLETRLDARRTEAYQAQAEKMAGRWRVTLLLPAGEWNVLPEEDQPIELVPGTPRATLRWTVTPERWSRQDKLFRFQLRGATGGVFRMSVVYPPTINAPNRFLLEVLGQALASIHG